MYGKVDEEDDISLIIEIPDCNAYVILVTSSVQTKSEKL